MSKPIWPSDFAEWMAEVERRLSEIGNTASLGNSSIETGRLDVYNGDSLQASIGVQADGTVGVQEFNGAPPPVPTAPGLAQFPGGLVAMWDGFNADGTDVQPLDWNRLEVHAAQVDGVGFSPTVDTLHTTIETPQGGRAAISFAVTDPATVLFVARNTSGVASAPSAFTVMAPGPAGAATGINGTDIDDFSITARKFLDNRHRLY